MGRDIHGSISNFIVETFAACPGRSGDNNFGRSTPTLRWWICSLLQSLLIAVVDIHSTAHPTASTSHVVKLLHLLVRVVDGGLLLLLRWHGILLWLLTALLLLLLLLLCLHGVLLLLLLLPICRLTIVFI